LGSKESGRSRHGGLDVATVAQGLDGFQRDPVADLGAAFAQDVGSRNIVADAIDPAADRTLLAKAGKALPESNMDILHKVAATVDIGLI